MTARIEYGSTFIHGPSNSQEVLIEKIQLKALKMVLGLRFSTPANIVLREANIPPLEIQFLYLACNFVTRMLAKKAYHLCTTLVEIIDYTGNPVNIDKAGMVILIESFRDIVPKEHLIGKASLPLCCETTFTLIRSRQSVGIDRGMKLATSSKTSSLRDLFRRGTEGNQEPLHRQLQIRRKALRFLFCL